MKEPFRFLNEFDERSSVKQFILILIRTLANDSTNGFDSLIKRGIQECISPEYLFLFSN